MATPPARIELADAYPKPSNAELRTGLGRLWDYATGLLGATGSAADARTALGVAYGPAFSATRSVDQSISNNTDTVAIFEVEQFDTASCYNPVNGRFTPNVAGYYQINANMFLAGSGITLASFVIRKNGITYQTIETIGVTYNALPILSGSVLVHCNGTTDYIDLTAYTTAASGGNAINAGSRLSGFFVRPA